MVERLTKRCRRCKNIIREDRGKYLQIEGMYGGYMYGPVLICDFCIDLIKEKIEEHSK